MQIKANFMQEGYVTYQRVRQGLSNLSQIVCETRVRHICQSKRYLEEKDLSFTGSEETVYVLRLSRVH